MIDLPEPGLTTPGPDARGLTGAVGPWLPGPLLFARFAFPPNRLGLCGPESGETLPERVRTGRLDPELTRIAQQFEGVVNGLHPGPDLVFLVAGLHERVKQFFRILALELVQLAHHFVRYGLSISGIRC